MANSPHNPSQIVSKNVETMQKVKFQNVSLLIIPLNYFN